jgi:hypothetical protein
MAEPIDKEHLGLFRGGEDKTTAELIDGGWVGRQTYPGADGLNGTGGRVVNGSRLPRRTAGEARNSTRALSVRWSGDTMATKETFGM